MPVFSPEEATTFETHGASFRSYVAPSRGSRELCAWRLEVPAGLDGVAHRPNREEVLLVLDGELGITIDGIRSQLHRGDVALVPAHSRLQVDGGHGGATAWVATTPGLEAEMADGTLITPPWGR